MNKKSKLHKLTIFFILLLIIIPIVYSITLILQTADTENLEDTYNIIGSFLELGSYDTLRSGGPDVDNINTIFIKFALPDNVNGYNSTILSLYFYDADNSGAWNGNNNMSIYGVSNQTWIENCYGHSAPGQICPFSNIGSEIEHFNVTTRINKDNSPRWVNFTVTSYVNTFVKQNVSFAINNTVPSTGALYKFYSKEYTTDTSLRPKLILIYTIPGVNIIYPTNTSYNINVSNLNYTYTDSSYCWYSNSSGVWNSSIVSAGTNFTNVISKEGSNTWTIYCNDSVNNFNSTSITFSKDTTGPQVNITFPSNNSNFSYTNVNINYTRSDTNLGSCKWTNNSGITNTTVSNCANLTSYNWAEGQSTVIIYINDSAGNTNSSRVTFTIDTIKPTISIAQPQNTTYRDQYNYSYSLNVSSTDSGLGVSRYWYSLNGGTNTTFTPNITLTGLIAGSNNLKVYVNDTVGNTNSSTVIFYLGFTPKINNIIITNNSQNHYLDFDGVNDYVGLGAPSSLQMTENITLSVWVQTSSFAGTPMVLGYNNDANGNSLLYGFDSTRKPSIWMNASQVLSAYSIPSGTWTNVVWVFDNSGNNVSYYIDGVYQDSDTLTTGIPYSNGRWNIGAECDSASIIPDGNWVDGGIDEMRIYNRTLSAAEILGINNSGRNSNSSISSTGLVSWYDFEDYGTSTLEDNTGNNDGTIYGAEWTDTYYRNEITDSQSSLVGWWKLDKNYTIQEDSSGNNSNGTLVGSPIFTNNGVIGGAYNMNKTGGVYVSNQYNLSTWSVAYWMYQTENTTSWAPQVDKGYHGTDGVGGVHSGWSFLSPVSSMGCGVLVEIYRNTTWSSLSKYNAACNQWHHIVGTFNGTHASLYFDNVLVDGPDAVANFAEFGNKGLGIGVNELGNASASAFNGSIDEVRLYNRVLSTSEVNDLYSATNPTFQEYVNATIIANITDEDTAAASLYYSWYVDSVSVLTGFAQNVLSWIFTSRSSTVNLIVNDTNNYFVNQTWNISQTFINPTINFTGQTPSNSSNYSASSLTFNITGTEANLDTAKLTFNNINYTMTCNKTNPYYCNYTLTALTDGLYNFSAWINDSVGNTNSTETRKVRIDMTPPVTTANRYSPPDGASYTFNTWTKNNVQVLFSVYDSGVGVNNLLYPKYCTDTTNICTPSTYDIEATISTEGTSYIRYYSNDTLNNKETTNSQTIKIDTIAPNISIAYPTNYLNLSINTSINLNFSVADANSGLNTCWYNLDNGINTTIPNCLNTTFNCSQGQHTIYLYVNDSINNINSTSVIFTSDVSNPNATLLTPQNNSYNNTNQNFTANVTDNLGIKNATLNIWNNTGQVNQTTFTFGSGVTQQVVGVVVTLIDNIYKWWYTIFDWSGNKATTNNYTFTKDNTNPNINITFPLNNSNFSYTNVNINYTRSDTNLGSCWYSNDTYSVNTTLSGCSNITINWIEGQHNITIWTNDSPGNTNSSRVTFRVDLTAPNLNIILPENATYKDEYDYNLTLNLTRYDSGAGISSYWYSLNSGANITFTPNITLPSLVVGSNNLIVWINDSVGNTNSSNVTFYLAFTPKINDINVSNSTTSYDRNTNTSLSDGLVGWWGFDKNSTTTIYDSSTNGNNGNVSGAVFTDYGKIGGAYSFNGINNRMNISRIPAYDFGKGNISYSLWIKTNGKTGTQQIIGRRTLSSNNFEIQLTNTNTLCYFFTNDGSNGGTLKTSSVSLNNNTWYFITVTREINSSGKGTGYLYLDGNIISNSTNMGGNITAYWNIVIGDDAYGGEGEFFNGSIDEVRIYNRSLSASEISQLYSITNPTFQEYANVTINATITDEDSSSFTYEWFVNQVSVLISTTQNFLNWIFTGRSTEVTLKINDSNGYSVNQTWNISTTHINPTINFTGQTPGNNSNYSASSLTFNITGTEANLDTAKLTFNNINYTMTCNKTNPYYCNYTLTALTDGLYNFSAWINDSVGNTNLTETRQVTVDTTYPLISYGVNTAVNHANISKNFVYINTTWIETNFANITFTLANSTWSNATTYTSAIYLINFTNIADGYYWYYVNITDSENNKNSTGIYNITIDTTNPLIEFGTGMASTGSNLSQNWIYLNVSFTEINFKNMSFTLKNDSGIVNQTNYTTPTYTINWTNLPNKNYTYYVNITDSANNKNSTSIGYVVLDTEYPGITLLSPLNNSYNNTDQNFTANLTDNLGIKNATLYIYNQTGLVYNYTFTFVSNTLQSTVGIVVALIDNVYTWFYDIFDWAGNKATTNNYTITIDKTNPMISITSPQNNSNLSYNNVNINYTTLDVNNKTCWYSNDTYSSNTTLIDCNNITSVTWSEGNHNVTIWINDPVGNLNSSSVSFYVDTLPPTLIWLSPIDDGSVFDGYTNSFNYSVSDSGIGLSSCWWSNSSGIVNHTISCGTNITDIENIEGAHNITLWANDTLNNINSIIRFFNINSNDPIITLSYPSYNYWWNNGTNRIFNFSIIDTHTISECQLWGNWTGTWHLNQTNQSAVSNSGVIFNFNPINISDGNYKWNVWCNETGSSRSAWYGINRTIHIDTIYPQLTLINPLNQTYTTNQLTINFSSSDINRGTCWYNINNTQNITLASCNNITFTANQGSSTLRIFVNDSAGNTNSTNVSFFVDSIYPLIEYGTGTALDYANLSQNFTYINLSTTETNLANMSYTLYNSNNSLSYAGLIGYWNFDRNTTSIYDQSGNNYFGTPVNTVWDVNGRLGGEINIMGSNSYIDINSLNVSSFGRNFSLSLWIKASTAQNTDNNGRIIAAEDYSPNRGMNIQMLTNGELYFSSNPHEWIFSNNKYNDSVWHLLSMTWNNDTNNLTAYVDGVSIGSVTGGPINVSSTRPLVIGGSSWHNPNLNFNGSIDEVMIFNRTLSDSEVSALYNRSLINHTEYTTQTNTINFTNLNDGYYSYFADILDVLGNYNTTSIRNIFLDTHNPNATLLTPLNNSYNNTNQNFTANLTDNIGIKNATLHIYNSTGSQISSTVFTFTQNTIQQVIGTIVTLTDGVYTWFYKLFDFAGNSFTTQNNTFTKDTIIPQINFTSPSDSNGTYVNRNFILVNVTINETNTKNITIFLYNQTNLVNYTNSTDSFYSNFSSLLDGIYYFNSTSYDLALNPNSTETRQVTIDTTYPLIEFGTGTEINQFNTTNIYIYANVSVTETNEDTITFNLYDSNNNSVNSTSFTDNSREITWSNLIDGIYYYNVTINDSAGNTNFTETRLIRLDDTAPSITIDLPQEDAQYSNNNSINLNYTVTDNLIDLVLCSYRVINSTGNTIKSTSYSSCQNTTFTLPGGDISYTLTLFAKDNLSNPNSQSVNFAIRTNSPAITLYPTNNTQRNSLINHYFNFTSTTNTAGINTCELWGNFNGTYSLNQTKTSVSKTLMNSFNPINLSEGTFLWNVWCNDTLGNSGWGTNLTFVTDITNPLINITTITPTSGSQTFNFNSTSLDTNSITCKYSIYNNNSIDGLSSNISFSCNTQASATTSTYGTFNLTIYATDLAGNINSSTQSFTTQASSGTPSGGGGTTTINQTITVESNQTFCGDKYYSNWTTKLGLPSCQNPSTGFPTGNDAGLVEDYFNCPNDCPGADVDSVIWGCLDGNPETNCVWTGSTTYQYIALFGAFFIFILGASTIEDKKSGKQVNTVKYYYLKVTGRRKSQKKHKFL